jgi:hypothetical protein
MSGRMQYLKFLRTFGPINELIQSLIFKIYLMKKLFAIALGIFIISTIISTAAFAQPPHREQGKDLKNNEIKINVGSTAFAFPEFTYERIIGEDMGVGLSGAFSLVKDYAINFQIVPYYRMYFSRKKAAGFFIEANFGIVGQTWPDYYYDYSTGYPRYNNNPNTVNAGFGVAAGFKFINRNGFIGEAFGGLGRLLGNEDLLYLEVYPRVGVSLGKRF